MGQNMVGWVRLKVRGPAGSTVVLRHAEILDGAGNVYTDNLRGAKQTISYTLKGVGDEVYEPSFTIQGFRYVAVSGFPESLTPASVTGVVVHSAMESTGEFETSNALVNQLQRNIAWSLRGNFVDVPTDCPQRDERLGWTGDAQLFAATAAFNRDVSSFYTKWLADMSADQYADGDISLAVPDVLSSSIRTAINRRAAGEPGWGDAATVIPWDLYLAYGDLRVLETQYATMEGWVQYQKAQAGDQCLWRGDFLFGDWLDFYSKAQKLRSGMVSFSGVTSKDLIATAYFAHSTDILQKTATVLGYLKPAKVYQELFERIKRAFQKEFVSPDGKVGEGTQTGYVLALDFDLLSENQRAAAASHLAENVILSGHLTTGFLGTPHLLQVLTRFGHLDVAYSLLNREEFPSWLYPVKQGATTIWERWDGKRLDGSLQDPLMNSFNHCAYGAVGEWMYSVMAGVAIDPSAPGYRRVLIWPQPGGGFTRVAATHRSLYGTIRAAWAVENQSIEVAVEIPANTCATVRLPHARLQEVMESGQCLADAAGIEVTVQAACHVQLDLGSGVYIFKYPMSTGG
jgi:alpha-L-rhamnosidase